MNTFKSKRCYLILWDHLRIQDRPRFKEFMHPLIEGIAPSRLSDNSIRMILQSIITAKSPLSLLGRVNCGKSFSSGEPIFRKDGECITCSVLRLQLKAQLIEELTIRSDSENMEIATWIEPRKMRSTGDKEIEILPRRKRLYSADTNKIQTIESF